ncbi:hypothetical protein [Solemya velum gill symbiont]|nr:hypothetical protein [Solemya velum gill symbiont]
MSQKTYVGLENDINGGMTPTGTLIRDAWVFGLLPESQTCKGWNAGQIQALYDKVSKAWEPYGHLVSLLPPELREKHQQIYDAAVEYARKNGWDPELDILDEENR